MDVAVLNELRQIRRVVESPSTRFRPALTRDGDQYCVLYGPNIHEGVAGFGATPQEAMDDFDRNWERTK